MAKELKRLVVIDGKSVFYRGYYAMPGLSTKDGTPTGGVYGFAVMALEVIKRLKPDYVCVAWDKPKTNIRRRLELYPQYKAGRKPPPPDFYPQIPLLHELLEAFGWPLYEADDYEADDIMGALAVKAREAGLETILVTSDLDMLQLVNGQVKVYALKKGLSNIEEYHPESFTAKYGIEPDQFVDMKAIKGDSSDNIPGVPGIGEKGAAQLLSQYKTLDGIYENIELISGSTKQKLIDGKESAYLSKKLAEIWTDAPVELDLKAKDVNTCDPSQVMAVLQKLEFRSLVRQLPEVMRVDVNDQTANLDLDFGGISEPKVNYIDSDSKLENLKTNGYKELIISTYASGKHGKGGKYLILSPDKTSCLVIDLQKISKEKLAKKIGPVIEDKTVKKIGYNIKSDIKVLLFNDIRLQTIEHDVLVGAFLINSVRREHSLTDLARTDLGYDGASLDDLSPDEYGERASTIMAVIRSLYNLQAKQMSELNKVIKLASDVEFPLIPILADMEYTGVKLDGDYLREFSIHLNGTISDLEQIIYGYADQEFNINSPAQLADILFNKLMLPTDFIKKGKTNYSTAASELAKLRAQHPIIDLISQYREVTKLKNTYVDTLPEMTDDNSRLHTTFNMTTAQTGRLSSMDPNLQNIPVRTDLGRQIREAFIADEGKTLISADYSQFELRLAAMLANDTEMIEAFNKDQDIHILTASEVFGIKPEEVTKRQRYEAKAVNFGILYGQGPHGLAEGAGMTYAAAKEFIDRYFQTRPKIKEYINLTREQALDLGYVETLLGRRRPTPDVKSSNFTVREAAYRAAVNMPVQGTAADLTKLAMIKVNDKLDGDCKMLLQIHDSILLECDSENVQKYSQILKEVMENIYDLPVKLKTDITSGQTWGDL